MCALVTGVQTCALPVCSLFRLQRDTRFASDKSPYKGWQGARLFHYRRRELAAPSFYIHLEPGECFVGAGLRSEEHTSELQSLMRTSYAVFCLKKKNIHDPQLRNTTSSP